MLFIISRIISKPSLPQHSTTVLCFPGSSVWEERQEHVSSAGQRWPTQLHKEPFCSKSYSDPTSMMVALSFHVSASVKSIALSILLWSCVLMVPPFPIISLIILCFLLLFSPVTLPCDVPNYVVHCLIFPLLWCIIHLFSLQFSDTGRF